MLLTFVTVVSTFCSITRDCWVVEYGTAPWMIASNLPSPSLSSTVPPSFILQNLQSMGSKNVNLLVNVAATRHRFWPVQNRFRILVIKKVVSNWNGALSCQLRVLFNNGRLQLSWVALCRKSRVRHGCNRHPTASCVDRTLHCVYWYVDINMWCFVLWNDDLRTIAV